MDLPKCLAQPLTTDGIFMIIHVYSLFVADFNIPQVVRIARFLDEASLKWRIASPGACPFDDGCLRSLSRASAGCSAGVAFQCAIAGAAIDGRWPVAKKWG